MKKRNIVKKRKMIILMMTTCGQDLIPAFINQDLKKKKLHCTFMKF